MKSFHKSNSINLFKPQVNTLLNGKVHLNPPISKAFDFAEICFAL